MASQVEGNDFYEVRSFIRGYHAYKDIWIPRIGVVLLLKREPENEVDKNAVAVTTGSGEVGGHVPYNLAPLLSQFLQRDCLYGPPSFITSLKTHVKNLQYKSLV